MLISNNPELDIQALTETVDRLVRLRRRATPLLVQDDPASPVELSVALLHGATAGGWKDVVRRLPLLGPLALGLVRFGREFSKPEMSWKQRLRRVPFVGGFALWCHTILHLNAVRQEIAVQMDELRRLQHAASTDFGARIAVLEALELPLRLNKIEQQTRYLATLDISKRMRLVEAERLGLEQSLQQTLTNQRMLDNRIASLTREAKRFGDHPQSAIRETGAVVSGFDQDDFYVEFENLFRGSEEVIGERLQVYLPYLSALRGDATARVVDVGCGRGEWLALMRAQGIAAIGVDLNRSKVDACRARGYQAECADGIAYLRAQPAGSIAVVSGFHIIEHLRFEHVIALFDAALHALRDDGLVIFETPNPENLTVGACNFYFDPTHLAPVVPAVAEFAARQRGFARAQILRLHPYPDEYRLVEDSEAAVRLNNAFYGPQDYALLGWKTNAA